MQLMWSQVLKVTSAQKDLRYVPLKIKKWLTWFYLGEIITSLVDRQIMLFEWYHLRAAALLLTLFSVELKNVVLCVHVCGHFLNI